VIWAALGLVLLGVLIGGAGMRAHLRRASALWRPGAGLLALAAFAGALILLLREDWLPALALAAGGSWLALSARRRAGPPSSVLSQAEARAILGVGEGATPAEIQIAYRRLMARVHPDAGGAPGLAAQLNAARDVLLQRKR
jgi:hypothetical protein